jgi:ABC-type cobalamin/Fe3+-siderophores transport system ATPase subunit
VLQLQLLHQLLRQRRQAVVPAVHQVEVQALAAEPLVVLDRAELLVVREPAELLVVRELVLRVLELRVREQLRQEQLRERSRLLVLRLRVLVLLEWWVLRSLRPQLLIR